MLSMQLARALSVMRIYGMKHNTYMVTLTCCLLY